MRDRWQESESDVRRAGQDADELEARLEAGEWIPREVILEAMRRLKDASDRLLKAVQDEQDPPKK